ncbi:MAG: hypothetical protein GDA56_07705 [Hormoscilla sp. GM7CHS1pb]|nr:hypothetical protein [Hormoscilla sp. GM7CHS1pb]
MTQVNSGDHYRGIISLENLRMMTVQARLPRCRGKSTTPTVASRPETPTHVVRLG